MKEGGQKTLEYNISMGVGRWEQKQVISRIKMR